MLVLVVWIVDVVRVVVAAVDWLSTERDRNSLSTGIDTIKDIASVGTFKLEVDVERCAIATAVRITLTGSGIVQRLCE